MAELYEEYAGNEKKFVTPGVPANPLTLFDAHKDVCTWSCQHFAACEIWAVDIFAFSRGVPLAIDLANRLNFEGCDCGETKILPVRIRFLGLIDPVVRAVFGLPIKYPYSAPPNVAFAIQHVRSLIGQTAKDAQFPLSPVPNVWRTTWGPWDRDGKLVPAEHGNMGNPNNPNDIVGLGAAVKRTLKAEAASVGVRWK